MKINQALTSMAKTSQTHIYQYYDRKHGKNFHQLLEMFLGSTMDEVRLRRAVEFATQTMNLFDVGDATFFRQLVLQREVFRRIAYDKQRDHTAHTVNNWLLGWLLFEDVSELRKKMLTSIERRKIEKFPTFEIFGDLWMYASLLHDIGYMFEGSFRIDNTVQDSEYLSFALGNVHDYFHHRFWKENFVGRPYQQKAILKATCISSPDFTSLKSLTSVADRLRDLNDLSELERRIGVSDKPKQLSSDAFELWEQHFEQYSPANVPTIREVEENFDRYLNVGIPGAGVKVLDHGVCSGLLQLQYSTFYFRVASAIKSRLGGSLPETDRKALSLFIENTEEKGGPIDFDYWWQIVVWSTGATAVHNLVQQEKKKYSVDSDPLTYLGILVDCIQCWDRFSVNPLSIFSGAVPAQSAEVEYDLVNGRAVFSFQNQTETFIERLRDELNNSLLDWDQFIEIRKV
jgi:hypothetical protein